MRRLVSAAYAHGENGLGGAVFPEPNLKPVTEPAAEFIRHIVRKYPNEVTLITIGPLTNVATALNADPELAGMIKSLVMMGGSLSGGNVTPAAEFNFYVDPEAARIIFDSGIPLTMVGLDVTRKALFRDEHLKALQSVNTPVCRFDADMMKRTLDRFHEDSQAHRAVS